VKRDGQPFHRVPRSPSPYTGEAENRTHNFSCTSQQKLDTQRGKNVHAQLKIVHDHPLPLTSRQELLYRVLPTVELRSRTNDSHHAAAIIAILSDWMSRDSCSSVAHDLPPAESRRSLDICQCLLFVLHWSQII